MHRNKAHNYCKFKRQISWCVVRQGYGTLDSWLSSWSSWNNNKRDHNSAIPRPTVKKKKHVSEIRKKDIPVPWTRKITHFLQRTTQYSSRREGGWWGVKWFSGGTEGGIVRIQQNLMGGSGKFYCYNQILWPPPPLPSPSSAQELTIKTWAFLRYFSLNELQNIQTVCQRS